MRVHILQHVPFEGPGTIGTWLAARKALVSYTRFFSDPTLPTPEVYHLIVALGGPMSVNDEAALPWLKQEKRFLAQAMAASVPVLGICLGAQLIASALGARVYPNQEKEIGWFDVEGIPAGPGKFAFPATTPVLHWHGETFDLPHDATHLARSAACENQAFQYGHKAVGLQFHLEMTPASVGALITNCRDELTPGPFIQSEETLRAVPLSAYAEPHAILDRLLEFLTH